MTERWTEGGFFKNRPPCIPSQTHTHTLGLIRTPALSQQQGQAGCTSQSQHHLSEQSISEEKQRTRGKKTQKEWRQRERERHGGKMRTERREGARKPFEAISCRRSGHPLPLSFTLYLLLLFIVLLLCFPPLLRAHSRPPASTPYWISVGILCF